MTDGQATPHSLDVSQWRKPAYSGLQDSGLLS